MTEQDSKLADRIEAARERSTALAANASSKAREFVHDHPVASVAGGIVVGALIAGVLTRRRQAKAAPAADALPSPARLARLAGLGAELALAYASRAASSGKDGLGKIEERIAGQLGRIGENGAEAGHKLSGLADLAITTLREAGEAAVHRWTQRNHDTE